MAKKKFNLADYLPADAAVSNSDTMEIRMIHWEHIRSNEANFYDVDDVTDLVNSIEMHGLLDPVVVIPDGDAPDRWVLISGHRRHKAWGILLEKDPNKYAEIPAVIRNFESPAMAELALIMANSSGRVLTSAETSRQAERVEMLFYELKEQGYEFPGRMRDRVAEACKVSASKLARLRVIRENLIPKLKKVWEAGDLNEATAYEFAKHPENVQRKIVAYYAVSRFGHMCASGVKDRAEMIEEIPKRKCTEEKGTKCSNCENMLERIYGEKYRYRYSNCRYCNCCSKCSELTKCIYACPKLAGQIAKAKADARAAKKEDRAKAAEERKGKIDFISMIWQRFGQARRRAKLNPTAAKKAMGIDWYFLNDVDMKALESGEQRPTQNTRLPFTIWDTEAKYLINAADAFGCSTDYLLGRTDDFMPVPAAVESPQAPAGWRRCLVDEPEEGQTVVVVDPEATTLTPYELYVYRDGMYCYATNPEYSDVVTSGCLWLPIPSLPEEDEL